MGIPRGNMRQELVGRRGPTKRRKFGWPPADAAACLEFSIRCTVPPNRGTKSAFLRPLLTPASTPPLHLFISSSFFAGDRVQEVICRTNERKLTHKPTGSGDQVFLNSYASRQ